MPSSMSIWRNVSERRMLTLPELHEKVKEILSKDEKKLIVFTCNWSLFPGMQLSESTTLVKMPYGIIVSMCSGRIAPELILDALEEGAWGVMVAGCPPEECDHDGNYKTRRRLVLLKHILKDLNIDPERIRLEWFSTGESAKLKTAIDTYMKDLETLGPIKTIEEKKIIHEWKVIGDLGLVAEKFTLHKKQHTLHSHILTIKKVIENQL